MYLQGLQFYMTCSSRRSKQFCNFVSGANLSEYFFTHVILKQASQFRLQENSLFRSAIELEFLHAFYKQAF